VARKVLFWLGREGISPASLSAMVQRTTARRRCKGDMSSGKVSRKACACPIRWAMAAAARSSLLGKCLYRLALAIPTLAATSSTVMASKPFSASSRFTERMMASSRACSICFLKETLTGATGASWTADGSFMPVSLFLWRRNVETKATL